MSENGTNLLAINRNHSNCNTVLEKRHGEDSADAAEFHEGSGVGVPRTIWFASRHIRKLHRASGCDNARRQSSGSIGYLLLYCWNAAVTPRTADVTAWSPSNVKMRTDRSSA